MRERMSATVDGKMEGNKIAVKLSHSLDPAMYNQPLTLRTSVPSSWKKATITQGDKTQQVVVKNGVIIYDVMPNKGDAVIVNK
jgi:hypothetical protein